MKHGNMRDRKLSPLIRIDLMESHLQQNIIKLRPIMNNPKDKGKFLDKFCKYHMTNDMIQKIVLSLNM